jgi:hypothetical protein
MNVSTLQQFLRSLVPALQAADGGLRIAHDLEGVCTGLEPFRSLGLEVFADFLTRCQQFQQSGAVSPASDFDLSGIKQSLQQIGPILGRLGLDASAAANSDLVQTQANLAEQLTRLASSVGLKGSLTRNPKWAEAQAVAVRARSHADALRKLAARIADPGSFQADDVRLDIERLTTDISGNEWKILANEFGVSSSTKAAKRVEEVLYKLTGHRPAKAKALRQSKPSAIVDEAKIAAHAGRLQLLLERARTEVQLPEHEINEELAALEQLNQRELAEAAKRAGIAKPGRSKQDILKRIGGSLSAGKRVMDQTAQ